MPGIALSHFIIKVTPWGWYYPYFIHKKIGSEAWFKSPPATEIWMKTWPDLPPTWLLQLCKPELLLVEGQRQEGLLYHSLCVFLLGFRGIISWRPLTVPSSSERKDVCSTMIHNSVFVCKIQEFKMMHLTLSFLLKKHLSGMSGNTQMTKKETSAPFERDKQERLSSGPRVVANMEWFYGSKGGNSGKGDSIGNGTQSVSVWSVSLCIS